MIKDEYPIIIIPEMINQYCNLIIFPPKEKKIPEDFRPKIILFTLLGLTALLIYAIIIADGYVAFAGILFVIVVLMFVFPFLSSRYTKDLTAYRDYEIEYELYSNITSTYNNRLNYCMEMVTCLFDKSSKPKRIPESKTYRRSRIKIDFEKRLNERFMDDIFIDYSINTCDYVPDFIYYNSITGVRLAIDIDTIEFRTKYDFIFKQKNDYFTRNNWPIIHFLDEELSKNPDKCIEVVNDVIKLLAFSQKSRIE